MLRRILKGVAVIAIIPVGLIALMTMVYLPIMVHETISPGPECVAEGGDWDEIEQQCWDGARHYKMTIFGREYCCDEDAGECP